MKDLYLMELENQINIQDAPNKKEILDKYSKRYDFGLEAGLTPEEIEKRLGEPREVIKKYINNSYQDDMEYSELLNPYSIHVAALSERVEFVHSKDNDVHVEFENIVLDNYNVEKTKDSVSIKWKKRKFLSLNRHKNSVIRIEIPKGRKLNDVVISTTSGKLQMTNFVANSVKITLVSADGVLNDCIADRFVCNTVSGDLSINELKTNYTKIDTVSGDVEIRILTTKELKGDTVSGDIIIHDGTIDSISSSSVSGDIFINGEESGKSVAKKLKGIFKNEK